MSKRFKVLSIGTILLLVVLAVTIMVMQRNNKMIENEIVESAIDNEGKKTVAIKKKIPLENFGQQMEQLCESGMRSGLENYVISKTLTFQDIAQLAERTPLFSYMREYTADSIAIPTTGITILSADVDGNGIEDIIEYGPSEANAREYSANRLIIYLGRVDGGYELSYSQLLFDTYVDWTDIIEVLRYEGETYLVFVNQSEQYLMDAYWISDGTLCGKLEFEYKCKEMKVEIIDNQRELKIDQLIENNIDIYHKVNSQHCTYDYWSNQFQRKCSIASTFC